MGAKLDDVIDRLAKDFVEEASNADFRNCGKVDPSPSWPEAVKVIPPIENLLPSSHENYAAD